MADKNNISLPSFLVFSILVLLHLLLQGVSIVGIGTEDGSEEWGYVEVRPKAHMFWWLYHSPQRVENSTLPWPIVLWLQGGPGASGVAIGNFQEIGPLDTSLQPRNSTWLQKADLLFVDNPVGTGFSYVEDENLLVKTDEEAATDLTTLLKQLFNKDETLQRSPLFIVAESYGGKFAVTVGLAVTEVIKTGELKLILGGVALGDSWISPSDFALSWGPLLKDLSRLDDNGLERSNNLAMKIKQQIENGQYSEATSTWSELEGMIMLSSNHVDFYNFLLDAGSEAVSCCLWGLGLQAKTIGKKYSRYLTSNRSVVVADDIGTFMNGVIRKKLQIIPKDVKWDAQGDLVFSALGNDFMKPRINEVDLLLSKGVNVTVYNGQVDLICATKGTEAWIQQLRWGGLKIFNGMERTPLYCGDVHTKGFMKSYMNFNFYWILEAGHFVPVDQPCLALKMVAQITNSPNSS